jgi:hypothetical protein
MMLSTIQLPVLIITPNPVFGPTQNFGSSSALDPHSISFWNQIHEENPKLKGTSKAKN